MMENDSNEFVYEKLIAKSDLIILRVCYENSKGAHYTSFKNPFSSTKQQIQSRHGVY